LGQRLAIGNPPAAGAFFFKGLNGSQIIVFYRVRA